MALLQSDADLLELFLNPTYVSLPQWLTQLVATSILTALVATAVYRSRVHLLARVQAEVLRSDVARYVSPDIADALVHQTSSDFGAPATRKVAVLFADIVGFTALNERLSPERTFALLRSFQERSTQVVFRHQGTLDKYLGDGFMATFGSFREESDAAARALACAFELLAASGNSPRCRTRLSHAALVWTCAAGSIKPSVMPAEPFDALMPPEIIRRRLAFAEPIGSREALSDVVTRLCGDLCSDLAAKALGVRRLDLVFGRVDRASQAVQVKTAKPNRDPAHLARLLADRLDFIDPGFGIEDGLLIASRVEPLAPKQTSAQGLSNEEAEANSALL